MVFIIFSQLQTTRIFRFSIEIIYLLERAQNFLKN